MVFNNFGNLRKQGGNCRLCKYMKSNTLHDIRRVLIEPTPRDRVVIPEDIRKRAKNCVEAMFKYAEAKS